MSTPYRKRTYPGMLRPNTHTPESVRAKTWALELSKGCREKERMLLGLPLLGVVLGGVREMRRLAKEAGHG